MFPWSSTDGFFAVMRTMKMMTLVLNSFDSLLGRKSRIRAYFGLILVVGPLIGGCRYGEMYDQPKFEPFKSTEFFSDNSSARPVVPGTIPNSGGVGQEGSSTYLTGRLAGNTFAIDIPSEVFRELTPGDSSNNLSLLLNRGQGRFGIFCAPCHGIDGAGKGPIVLRGFSPPPQLYEEKVVKQPLGYYFDVITNGHGAMYGYGARIHNPSDRWAIAAYLRALQLSQNISPELIPALPSTDREKLQGAESVSVPTNSVATHAQEVVK